MASSARFSVFASGRTLDLAGRGLALVPAQGGSAVTEGPLERLASLGADSLRLGVLRSDPLAALLVGRASGLDASVAALRVVLGLYLGLRRFLPGPGMLRVGASRKCDPDQEQTRASREAFQFYSQNHKLIMVLEDQLGNETLALRDY